MKRAGNKIDAISDLFLSFDLLDELLKSDIFPQFPAVVQFLGLVVATLAPHAGLMNKMSHCRFRSAVLNRSDCIVVVGPPNSWLFTEYVFLFGNTFII